MNYDRLVVQYYNKDDLPLLSDLEIPLSDIQTISKIMIVDEYQITPDVPSQDVPFQRSILTDS